MNIRLNHQNQSQIICFETFSDFSNRIKKLDGQGRAVVAIDICGSYVKIPTYFDLSLKDSDLYLKSFFDSIHKSSDFLHSIQPLPGKRKIEINGIRMIEKKRG